MRVRTVRPGVVAGRLVAPPSKSYTHRALVAGHLAHRVYRIDNPLDSNDTRATAGSISVLGSRVEKAPRCWSLRPRFPKRTARRLEIDCGESGTTLRFATALAARDGRPVTFLGQGRLPRRPMRPLVSALRALGAKYRALSTGASLPAVVRGPIHGGAVSLDASESSQFASALLMVLPTLSEDSSLKLVGDVVSRPYLDATLSVLRFHKVRIRRRGDCFEIPGRQRFQGSGFPIPGDASSAAYFWVAAAISGGEVRVDGISRRWPQADLSVLRVLDLAGASVKSTATGATVSAGHLRPFRVDLTDSPDLVPLAGVLAATIPGSSDLVGAAHAAAKESDRRAGTLRLVRALGARGRLSPDGIRVDGTRSVRPFALRDEGDHRIVMSAAVGALVSAGPCSVGDPRAVEKSFPGFWDALRSVSGGSERT